MAQISKTQKVMKSHWISTSLGPMFAVADDEHLYLLDFANRKGLEKEVQKLKKLERTAIIPGKNKILDQIENELAFYFQGMIKEFKTPIALVGSEFQKTVLKSLLSIKYGQVTTYRNQAQLLGNLKALRAIASANGRNQLAIIIPCHRVIGSNGELAGYSGGLDRKEWLLNHEKKTYALSKEP